MHENDVAALMGLRGALDELYAIDLARGAGAHASSVWGGDPRYAARLATDGDPATFWAPAANDTAPELTVELGQPRRFDRIVLGEHLPLGQRVAAFTVEARVDGQWRQWGSATTIGRKRILVAAPIEADAVRVRCLGKGSPALALIEVYRGE